METESSSRQLRAKSALRFKYEAEVEVLKQELGDLEKVRERLGLSRREICQLLMVDPSAWTRWTRPVSQIPTQEGAADAPPHIYQALRWYLKTLDTDISRQTMTTTNSPSNPLPSSWEEHWRRTRILLFLMAVSQILFVLLVGFAIKHAL